MRRPKQTHIFATKSDLVPGLNRIEAELGVRYARCGSYAGSIIEQYSSLLAWNGLGENTTGEHTTGPQFLVVPKLQKINIEPVEGLTGPSGTKQGVYQKALLVDPVGQIVNSAISVDKALALLDDSQTTDRGGYSTKYYAVNQKLNPDSIVFSPGGIYKQATALIAGHIGTISESKIASDLYKHFLKSDYQQF